MGVLVVEGMIVEWLKWFGDWVECDEIVCFVIIDKIDVEIFLLVVGWLVKILVELGDIVDVGIFFVELDAGVCLGEVYFEEY